MVKTGESVGVIYHPDYLIHTQNHHPERKERLEHINSKLNALTQNSMIIRKEAKPASRDEISLVHDLDYISAVEDACLRGSSFLDMDTYIVPQSFQVARLSSGGALTGLRGIMNNEFRKCFVLNRPPGHHAERNKAMGFCIFNSVAIAAEVAKRDFNFQRIAILDWDVHHGNGTQNSFARDNQVLFVSIHQSPAYPGTGRAEDVGFEGGRGFTVNIPLPAGCGDEEYSLVFDRIIEPVLNQFRPELIIVSAGQDAYRYDPLAGMELTHRGYFDMANFVALAADRWSDGRVLLCLEGGYHLEGQAEAVLQIMNALGRWNLPKPEPANRSDISIGIEKKVEEINRIQKSFWDL